MAEGDHGNDKNVIVNGVDDAIAADTHSEARSAAKRLGTRRTGILAEQCDRTADPITVLVIDLLQGSNRGRTQLDSVGHDQPRSAFTCAHGMLGPSSAIASSNAATSSESSSASIIR